MGFQDKLVNIRIHLNNFSHQNIKIFYQEFRHWLKNQNFDNRYFKRNRSILEEKREYLRLIDLLINEKKFYLINDILKIDNFVSKIKLLAIFFSPSFFIKIKLKYF